MNVQATKELFWKYTFKTSVHISKNAEEIKFSIKDVFSKCDQIWSFLRILSYLMKKSLRKNFVFCAGLQTIWLPQTGNQTSLLLIRCDFLKIYLFISSQWEGRVKINKIKSWWSKITTFYVLHSHGFFIG